MKQRGVFFIGLILIAVYFFLFPRASGRELIISPSALLIFDDANLSSSSEGQLTTFQNDTTVGYLNAEHQLIGLDNAPDIAVDDAWMAKPVEGGVDILEPGGTLISRIQIKGYPVSRNGNLYIYDEDRLSKVDPVSGRILWTKEYISLVTVLDAAHGRTLVGLMDGRVYLIDHSGEILLNYRPGGSRLELIYGGALSSDGSNIAIIAGLDPQRFIILEERKNGFRPIIHHDTGMEFRRGIPVGFVRDNREVIYENRNRVTAVDIRSSDIIDLPLDGSLASWQEDATSGILALLGREEQLAHLKLLSSKNLTVLDSLLAADTQSILGADEAIFIIGDDAMGILEFSVQ